MTSTINLFDTFDKKIDGEKYWNNKEHKYWLDYYFLFEANECKSSNNTKRVSKELNELYGLILKYK